jgi:hypothetical protein
MAERHEDGRRSWKSRLQERDAIWVVGILLVIFTLYGFAIYSSAHSFDFLLKTNVPFVSAVW